MGKGFDNQIISNNTNQILKQEINAILKGQSDRLNMRWLLLLEVLKKYTNLFSFKNDENLENIKPFIVKKLFWNGTCAVTKYGDKPIIVPFSNTKFGLDGYISSADVVDKNSNIYDEKLNLKKLNRDNTIFIQANVYRYPLFLGLDNYIAPILEFWPLMTDELKNAITKVIVKVNGEGKERDTILQEIDVLTQRQKGKLVTALTNKIGEIVELRTETINDKIWEHIKSSINFLNQRLGFLYNASEKRERNITSEVAINEMQFTLIRDDFMFHINKFVREYNKLFNKNVEVELLQDKIAREQAEMQAVNMLHQPNNQKGDDDNDKI